MEDGLYVGHEGDEDRRGTERRKMGQVTGGPGGQRRVGVPEGVSCGCSHVGAVLGGGQA